MEAVAESKGSGGARVEELTNQLRQMRAGAMPSADERDRARAGLTGVQALHPVHTLMEEHRFILASLRELEAFVERLQSRASFAALGSDVEVLKGIAHHLVDAENHHQREEDVLFPRMEAVGAALAPGIMREDHAAFRVKKRRLYQLSQAGVQGDFPAFKAEVTALGGYLARELTDHIFQEDTVVYQVALEILPVEEWEEVKRRCDDIGYCCFKPGDQAPAGA